MKRLIPLLFICFLTATQGCRQDIPEMVDNGPVIPATPYTLVLPDRWPSLPVTSVDNPLTKEGIALGRMLFYEPLLSGNNTLSCASCHKIGYAFADSTNRFSKGVTGEFGKRNAMPLFNLNWAKSYFWDGRSPSLEKQALKPVVDPIEMNESLDRMVNELNAHPLYPYYFKRAFGVNKITAPDVAKALAQFERTLISSGSKFDKSNGGVLLSPSEFRGMQIFFGEFNQQLTNPSMPPGGDCFHCHGNSGNVLFSTFELVNNGLDVVPDSGYATVTKKPSDIGKFKVPSVRNLKFTAPYMHDGRFSTLEQVIRHYNDGIVFNSPNLDPNLKKHNNRPLGLTDDDINDLISFLNTLNDEAFTQNQDNMNPFK